MGNFVYGVRARSLHLALDAALVAIFAWAWTQSCSVVSEPVQDAGVSKNALYSNAPSFSLGDPPAGRVGHWRIVSESLGTEELIRVDREELSALVGAVQEVAAAVKRMEDRQNHMDGLMAKIVDRLDRMDERLTRVEGSTAHIEAELHEFRKENRENRRRLDHHDRMLMEHDRRIEDVEAAQADS